jgi:hypothetical protein
VRRAETGDAVVEVAREIEGTLEERPFRPRPAVAADRDLAAGIRRPAGVRQGPGAGPDRRAPATPPG